jgi:hypothetical protein
METLLAFIFVHIRGSVPAENPFFEHPILNGPYDQPNRHWELDSTGQPTQKIVERRRRAEFITPIPKPRKRKGQGEQASLILDEGQGLTSAEQQYAASIINELRAEVDAWRALPSPSDWLVTPETTRLLQHWRHHEFNTFRPFFCQVEAVETAIWLTEVAPKRESYKNKYLKHLIDANKEANPELVRLALKLATGAGKTTVMAMIIAWQTVNAVHSRGNSFTKGFLVVAPGLTIKDRLSVLQPNDPYSYYKERELVPTDMLQDLLEARIVTENFHKFKLRERIDISKGGRALVEGRTGPKMLTLETEGQMIQRVLPELMGMKNILVQVVHFASTELALGEINRTRVTKAADSGGEPCLAGGGIVVEQVEGRLRNFGKAQQLFGFPEVEGARLPAPAKSSVSDIEVFGEVLLRKSGDIEKLAHGSPTQAGSGGLHQRETRHAF